MMRRESVRAALILAGAFVLAAGVGLAFSMGFDHGSKPTGDAFTPAEIAAALPALEPATMRVDGLAKLHARPPVKPVVRHRARRHKRARRHVVRVLRPAAAPVVRAAPRAVVQPQPQPQPAAPAPVATPAPAPAPRPKPAPRPAPAKAPVVFDDSA